MQSVRVSAVSQLPASLPSPQTSKAGAPGDSQGARLSGVRAAVRLWLESQSFGGGVQPRGGPRALPSHLPAAGRTGEGGATQQRN